MSAFNVRDVLVFKRTRCDSLSKKQGSEVLGDQRIYFSTIFRSCDIGSKII